MQFRPDAEKIKRWREERLWSQEHLADLAGVGLRTVQRIENGDPASRDSVMALAAAFNVEAAALTINADTEAAEQRERKAKKGVAALRLGFLINLACWVFGMLVLSPSASVTPMVTLKCSPPWSGGRSALPASASRL